MTAVTVTGTFVPEGKVHAQVLLRETPERKSPVVCKGQF